MSRTLLSMRLVSSVLCMCVLLFIGGEPANAQEPLGPHATMKTGTVDEYGPLTFKAERQRLDWLASLLRRMPDHAGHIIAYAGRRACSGEARRRAVRAKDYLIKGRGVRPSQIRWLDGGHREGATVELWLQPPDGPEPTANPTVDPNGVRTSKACKAGPRKRPRVPRHTSNNGMHPTRNQRGSHH